MLVSAVLARRRELLLALEVAWYVVVLYLVLTRRIAGFGPSQAAEYYLLTALAAVFAAAAVARRWVPARTGLIAVAVLGAGVVLLLVLAIGPLGPVRQTLSLAVGPVLLAASVRRSRIPVAVGTVVLAAVAAALDTRFGGYTLSVNLARAVVGETPTRALVALAAAFVVVAPVAVGLLLRSADATRAATALAHTRAEERKRLARELHDMVANHVTGIIVTAQAAGLSADAATGRTLESIEGAGNRALDAMHRMVTTLRSGDVVDLAPAGAAAGELPGAATPLDAVRSAVGDDTRVRVHDRSAPTDADPAVVTTVHRLVVEALTNARRHAPDGSPVDVEVAGPGPDVLTVQVTNDRTDGPGRTRSGGFGLVGLQERIDAVGGRLEAGPLDGRRWRVLAELPCRPG